MASNEEVQQPEPTNAVGATFTRTGALIVALTPFVAIIAWVLTLKSEAADAGRVAAEARADARAAMTKAEGAETLARDKGEKATEALNSVNVKLARIETLVENLSKRFDENEKAIKELRESKTK